jgi:hypothetical protein
VAARQTGCKAAWELIDVPTFWVNAYIWAAEAEAAARPGPDGRPADYRPR